MGGQQNVSPADPNPVERPGSTSLLSGGQFLAGAYDLKVRRKLLQQQIHAVDERCKRLADLLAKKRVTKTSGDVGERAILAPRKKPSTGNDSASTGKSPRHGLDPSHHQDTRDIVPGAGTSGGCQDGSTIHMNRGLMRLQELPTAAPFRKGGWIDHANKKYRLKEKQREMRKEAAAREISNKNGRNTQKARQERHEISVIPSTFPGRYLRGEVPCSKHFSAANALVWVCPLDQLDYQYYLPMFFDGIRCLEEPCKTLARQGICDLLEAARGHPERILPSLRDIIRMIRAAVSSKNSEILLFTCTALRALASGNKEVGLALVKYYKMFLHVFNLFVNKIKSTGDKIDYSQRNNTDIGEAVSTTIEELERHGGKDAFAYIKQCIPTYQSCII